MSKRQQGRVKMPRRKAGFGKSIEARFFKALCDPNRVGILARLAECGRPCTVTEVAQACPVCVSVVSRHLAQLKEAGILRAQKRGKEVYYSACCPEVAATLRTIADALDCCRPKRTSD